MRFSEFRGAPICLRPRDLCVRDKISGSHRYTSTSLIAARIGDTFVAPMLFRGETSDTLAFNAWLEHQLCPLLNETHVVILDNASFHKGSEIARLIAQTGAYLPERMDFSTQLLKKHPNKNPSGAASYW